MLPPKKRLLDQVRNRLYAVLAAIPVISTASTTRLIVLCHSTKFVPADIQSLKPNPD